MGEACPGADARESMPKSPKRKKKARRRFWRRPNSLIRIHPGTESERCFVCFREQAEALAEWIERQGGTARLEAGGRGAILKIFDYPRNWGNLFVEVAPSDAGRFVAGCRAEKKKSRGRPTLAPKPSPVSQMLRSLMVRGHAWIENDGTWMIKAKAVPAEMIIPLLTAAAGIGGPKVGPAYGCGSLNSKGRPCKGHAGPDGWCSAHPQDYIHFAIEPGHLRVRFA